MLFSHVMRVWVLVPWVQVCYVINSKAGISDVNVTNTAINHYQIMHNLLSLKTLTDRAIKQVPNAIHISVDNFLNSPRYEELLNNLKKDQDKA